MAFHPQVHNRRYMRLRGWDYSSPGCYFVTLCVKNKECFLADIVSGQISLNAYGKIVESRWAWLKEQYCYVELDAFIVMPNHVHGMIRIIGNSVVTNRDLSRNELNQKTDDVSVVTGRDLSLPTFNTTNNDAGIKTAYNTGNDENQVFVRHYRGF